MNLFDVYSLYDIEPVSGAGNYVYTADGTEYLDLYGGHAVISIGHAHPRYIDAVSRQVARLGFTPTRWSTRFRSVRRHTGRGVWLSRLSAVSLQLGRGSK